MPYQGKHKFIKVNIKAKKDIKEKISKLTWHIFEDCDASIYTSDSVLPQNGDALEAGHRH